MTKRHRVGVIGCGWVGTNRHVPSYKKDDRAVLSAVYDHKLSNARRAATNHDIPHAHDSLDEFFQENLDIVSICTPPWTHYDLSIRALENGVNVLSEKPMAMSPDQADEMVTTANDTGKTLGLVHNFLYASSMQKAKRKVRNGEVGEIRSVIGFQTSSNQRHLPKWYPKLPGQLFYDESPHLLYLLEEFLGNISVDNVSSQYDDSETQSLRTVNVGLNNDDGVLGSLKMVFDSPLSEWHLTIIGSEKILVVDIFRDILIELDKERSHGARDVVGTSIQAMLQETLGMASSGIRMVSGDLLFGMDELTSRYIDAIGTNAEPAVTAQEGARIVHLMHDIIHGAGIDPKEAPKGP